MNLNDLTVYQLYKSQINGLNKKIPNNLELSNFAKDQSIVKMYQIVLTQLQPLFYLMQCGKYGTMLAWFFI